MKDFRAFLKRILSTLWAGDGKANRAGDNLQKLEAGLVLAETRGVFAVAINRMLYREALQGNQVQVVLIEPDRPLWRGSLLPGKNETWRS
jgi:hypothetical protein